MSMESKTTRKESLSPIMRYTIVLVALLVTIISSGTVWNSNQPAEPMDMEARAVVRAGVVDIVHQGLGESWQRGLPAVQGITVNESPYGYIVKVRFAITDCGAENTLQTSARKDVQRIMQALYRSQIPMASVQMVGTFPVADPNGIVRETAILKGTLNAARAEGVNWNTLESDGLFGQLDSLWWHPSI